MQTMPSNMTRLSSFATAATLVLLLQGCGGGSQHSANTAQFSERRAIALSSNAVAAGSPILEVTRIEKIGETRIGRTVYDYTFKISVANRARTNARGVTIHLTDVGAGSTIIDGAVAIDIVRATGSASPDDTLTIRHDRAKPFDAKAFKWTFSTDMRPARFMGRLIDRPVENAYFQTASGYGGFTDGTGAFYYDVPGELIEFSVAGRTTIGTAAAAQAIHIYDLTTIMGRALPGDRVGQLLQSLDVTPAAPMLTLPELPLTEPSPIDYFASTSAYETAVGSLMSAYQVPRTAIVPIETAKSEALKSLASIDCPIVVAPPVRDGGTFEHDVSKLTCVEKARIDFFNRRVKMHMNSTLDEGVAQINLIEETFSATAVERIIEDSSMLAAVDGYVDVLNTFEDLTDAKKKEAHLQFARLGTQAAAWVASVSSKLWPEAGEEAIAKWTARSATATTVLFESQQCVLWWSAKKANRDKAIGACVKVLADVLEVPASELDTSELEAAAAAFDTLAATLQFDVTAIKGKRSLRAGAQIAAGSVKTAAKFAELALLEAKRSNPPKDPGPLLEGLSHALNTGVSELASGLANCVGIPKGSAGALAACRMSAVSLTSKSLIRSAMLSVGVGSAVRAVGRITDTKVAIGMLEDLLYAGAESRAELFAHYNAKDEAGLAKAMGNVKYGYEPVTWDLLMFRKIGNIVQGQLIFNPANVEREVAFWKSYIDSQVQPDINSTELSMRAAVQPDRSLVATITFSASGLGIAAGDLVCRAIGSADDMPIVFNFDETMAAAGIEVRTSAFQEAKVATLICSVYSDKRLIASQAYTASLDVPTVGLIGKYSFDNCTAQDSSGLGRDGEFGAACVADLRGMAARFQNPATNAYGGTHSVHLPPHTAASITFSAWVKWEGSVWSGNSNATGGAIWSLGTHVQGPFLSIWINEGGVSGDGGKIWNDWFPNSPHKLTPGIWAMLSLTSDGNGETLYINGEPVNSVRYPTPQRWSFVGQPSYLSKHFWANPDGGGRSWVSRFRGVLDDVRIYDRVLSEAEIQQLYRATRSE
jgi:hypothetical protein